MASITYDGQSLLIDGRRLWIVSGTVPYSNVPRAEWGDRIRAAKHAGLNTVETPVIWARHEPRQGQFDFQGENDLRHFVELVGRAGMYCILRPGPYVDAGWDLGGLPPWLLNINNMQLRTACQPFLEACSRYITAVAQQVRDLQATGPNTRAAGTSGTAPILMIQSECGWTCGDDSLGADYLGELSRYYRESGLNVPIINANELWQGVEGEIDGWTGYDNNLPFLRQLGSVRPDKPRIVVSFRAGAEDRVGRPVERHKTASAMLTNLAEVLAAGAQYNIQPFHGGTMLGFSGGRTAHGQGEYPVTSGDLGAPLSETGRPGASYSAVRRISTFASRFSRILSNLESRRHAAALLPSRDKNDATGPAIYYSSGVQGGVIFVFGDRTGAAKSQPATLLLPDGTTTRIDLGREPVGWYLFDAKVSGRITINHSNLCPFASAGQCLVMFGPAGAPGEVCINGSVAEVEVPRNGLPNVFMHEGVALVVASVEQIDSVHLADDGVLVGVSGVAADGTPIVSGDHPSWIKVTHGGDIVHQKAGGARNTVKSTVVRESHWKHTPSEWKSATTTDYVAGASARFASIAGPTDLNKLGLPYGYGWYRIAVRSAAPHKHRLLFVNGGDRLQVFQEGRPVGVWGYGPGAMRDLGISLVKGTNTLVVLAENFGRSSTGAPGPTGIAGPVWSVKPLRPSKPTIQTGDPIEPLKFKRPLWRVHDGDTTDPDRLTWTLQHKRKSPLFMTISGFDGRGLVLLNGKPVHFFDRSADTTLTLNADNLSKGKNLLQIALLEGTAARHSEIEHAVQFLEGVENLTEKAEWSFAKWEPPSNASFKQQVRKDEASPTWWRATFVPDESDTPVFFEATGLTKGQIFLNGRHLCRYFAGAASGKPVPPQSRYFLPRSFLRAGAMNEITVFDEHGASPARARLVADASGSAFDR